MVNLPEQTHEELGLQDHPQEHCNNREIDYSCGRGMGGSSAINFGVYSVGARDDYEEWARIVADDAFRWEKIQSRYKSLETFHSDLPAGVDPKYAAPRAEDHGNSGGLHVGFASECEKDLPPLLDVFEQAGFPLNSDHNSGNPIGMSVLINSAYRGVRSTAADPLTPQPENLTIVTDSPVQRLVLNGNKAVDVESNEKKYLASKEVILCAGSLEGPRILMHSGIGPAKQLERFNIPVKLDVPAIGQGLRDHTFVPLVNTRVENITQRREFYGDEKAMAEALEQWRKDRSGPWSRFACELGIGWFKLDKLTSSEEFQKLPAEEQQYLLQRTVPHYEILTHFPVHWFIPDFSKEALNYSCLLVFLFNARSRDPNVRLLFDPKFLSHPFDRRAAIESLRGAFQIAKYDGYTKDTVVDLASPKSDEDEDLLEYWRQNISSSWHMTGTIKMGKKGDPDAAVDNNFRFMGIDALRVADMSVVPVLANCHVQAVAYVTGATCAEKLIEQYGLA
ncbi:hypothetical protein BDV28DRAFT_144854 [Aspergillus coremiiformis]|uniref:Glucose-methanol-choline oxidoreductase N-terminal domain-containing protein n=1 Tax=Aspergillus coremiiformis TaxID=138285 RepID=A0A5N6ZGJ7_9EURO|nr:hypothetical protein BDV28DRAFT_144854 [Aspergillus coremiiformis]